ncbi:MAG: UTP--glucose-1-phosphate uridylyltransferase [Verrucomicrobia bacterium]|nr:MAG: UTP--glucose-1-phosphate uridylyltransferase [Verrucomicrobiota bacterium]
MNSLLVPLITSPDDAVRNRSLDEVCHGLPTPQLLAEADALERFRHETSSLYQRVRALLFLYAIHRFHLPARPDIGSGPLIPFDGYADLLSRRFEEAIQSFLALQRRAGPGDGLSSALAAAYHRLAFQTLADQVRRSVRTVRGNQWMFRMGHPLDHPLRIRPELLERQPDGTRPILRERTPVRMDLSHCGWSDIFFLGMDYPEGARVLNVSIDLGVHGRDAAPQPPVEAWLRVIDEPVLRLVSVDLRARADVTTLHEVFDFARDYLGLLKAAVIAAGIVPPGIEGSHHRLEDLLARLCGPGRGLELVSRVRDIPKGSRLAVSTSLLAALVAVCMRATGQTAHLTGGLEESERRLVLARALLGEWLGGSGGGWQDSGGVWPGIKLITGVPAREGDPEYGVSRGCLMPRHRILGPDEVSPETRQRLQESLVLVHGGMAQNVGPILEMVTEKYLLRCGPEWQARQEALRILEEILAALRRGDIPAIGRATTRNFEGPIQTIIPWATNAFTETLIDRAREAFGPDFHGFWMLGGMSGGGMGFIFAPHRHAEAQERMLEIMRQTRREMEHALPFAMEPVVYDFAINDRGTIADRLTGPDALMPPGYYTLVLPELLRRPRHDLDPARRAELDKFAQACRSRPELGHMVQALFDVMLPRPQQTAGDAKSLRQWLEELGFDPAQHEAIRRDLREGRIGLAQNRLPATARIEDVRPGDVTDTRPWFAEEADAPEVAERRRLGLEALQEGAVAVVSLAAGAGSRWTQGAGVVKALNPFCKLAGRHRTFVEVHLAKSRRVSAEAGTPLPHIFTTSYLTHEPIREYLDRHRRHDYPGPLLLSPGRSVGLRLVPTVRDLRFLWEETPQQVLDEQQQKVRDSLHAALIQWARSAGEASDYTDNVPAQCLHPVGHWYEVPNLLRNGVLRDLLRQRPNLRWLMLHNIDTLGADVDPALLGQHIASGATLTFEVITRRLEDRGGGLARVDGRVRLVEGLSMPREEDEFRLSYYNSMTTWIDIDKLLAVFGLSRDDLADENRVLEGIRALAARLPTYITIKDVKKRWGHGQEDVFPVTQFEKLWGDMTSLPEVDCRFLVVPRLRGQQLKDPAQLDGWLRDGSAAYVEKLAGWR